MILVADNDWSAVVKNLSWVMTAWRRMLRILSREGAAPQLSDFFLNAVVQAVLLFRSDTWVVTPRMGKALGGGVSVPGGKTANRTDPVEDTEQRV